MTYSYCFGMSKEHPILPRKSNAAGTKNEFTIAYIEKGRIIRKISLDGKMVDLV
jgi:hypothetical protein